MMLQATLPPQHRRKHINISRIFLTIVSVAAIAAAGVAYAAEPAYPVLGEVQQRMSKAVDGHAL
jgi:hypothetical protein